MKKYGLPIAVALVGALIVRLVEGFFTFNGAGTLVVLLKDSVLFAFGVSLCQKKRRKNESWFKKLILAFVVFFFVCWELGYVVFPALKTVFNFLGVRGFVVSLVYIYCGWAFFD